ncbi:hypothetical protein ACWGHM_26785 [Streptomyces sp. NPDC054904]|uniref:hypothetical protein n=1 Tax=unclassified Streptomyces TaxID=2593676 RepID=UPI002481E38B|nr:MULTISPECIES: hypothetical protein [unclassified Streptomyces]MDA5279314.1 hypothetical protein [Streptomyces sp. Isolate_45]MDX2395600.1 hypothetical protein [Streptomyces sp. DK15]
MSVDYPDAWDDGPTTGGACTPVNPTGDDSHFSARGEVYTEETRTTDGPTQTQTTEYGVGGSWE